MIDVVAYLVIIFVALVLFLVPVGLVAGLVVGSPTVGLAGGLVASGLLAAVRVLVSLGLK